MGSPVTVPVETPHITLSPRERISEAKNVIQMYCRSIAGSRDTDAILHWTKSIAQWRQQLVEALEDLKVEKRKIEKQRYHARP